MMYTDKVVACIKVNGKILRENGDTVTLPFGCEYSILIKNLNPVRAQITVAIDGTDAAGRLVIDPNGHLELERYIRNGNLNGGNRFKFIERTAEIEQHRGIGSDDGLIRVEAWKERVQQFVDVPQPRYYDVPYPVPRPYYPPRPPHRPWNRWKRASGPVARTSASLGKSQLQARSSRPAPPPRNDMGSPTMDWAGDEPLCASPGITVPGGESRQRFHTVMGFPVEPQSVVIVLRLRGQIEGARVETPVTVDLKAECSTCGKSNSAASRFCDRCGTALRLI